MTYQEYVIEVLREDQNCKGISLEEIDDIIKETEFSKIERWLLKEGYDLQQMYSNDYE